MNIGYAFLVVMIGIAYFVSGIPTPDEMIADFDAAQKFYTSSAYDQAIEKYGQINSKESRFLDEDKIIVEFGFMNIPVKGQPKADLLALDRFTNNIFHSGMD